MRDVTRQPALASSFKTRTTSVVRGMPGFVARAGLAGKILPLDQIAQEIVRATNTQVAARTQS